MSDPDHFDPDLSGTSTGEGCDGDYLPEDMDSEHCRECAAEIFGGEL